MDLQLTNRVALVTGASRGIGAAIATELAREGADLVVCARGQADLDALVRELGSAGRQVIGVAADLATAAGVQSVADAAHSRFGRVDILINNVGGAPGPGGFLNLDDHHWQAAWNLNLMSAVRFSRAVIPGMLERRWGRIVNIASTSAREPDIVVVHYNSAKAGLLALSKSLANTYAKDGILVNCVSPGLTRTPALESSAVKRLREQGIDTDAMTPDEAVNRYYLPRRPLPVGRVGRPDDIAGMVAFLASERAGWISGAYINVDGGWVKSIF